MNKFQKLSAGAAAAALMSVSLAAPAEAQFRDRYRDYGYDRGIGIGDVITGVAVLGGISAIANAIGRDGGRYGYGSRYRYRDDYRNAVNSCGYEAERAGRGRVSVTDVDRRGSYSYQVRGVIDSGYGGYDRGYGSYDRGYGSYDRGYGSYDRGYGGYDRGYDRYGYNNRMDRVAFTCTARSDGRITGFRLNDNYRW